jgi:hypothetical protein
MNWNRHLWRSSIAVAVAGTREVLTRPLDRLHDPIRLSKDKSLSILGTDYRYATGVLDIRYAGMCTPLFKQSIQVLHLMLNQHQPQAAEKENSLVECSEAASATYPMEASRLQ